MTKQLLNIYKKILYVKLEHQILLSIPMKTLKLIHNLFITEVGVKEFKRF